MMRGRSDSLFIDPGAAIGFTHRNSITSRSAPPHRSGAVTEHCVKIEAADPWRRENRIFSLAPDKIANFAVMEDALTAVDWITLKHIAISGTVFERGPFPASRGQPNASPAPVRPREEES
jgi:hypothetical protein